jgi:hypothetical protein
MAKRSVRIPPELLGEVSEENRKWFEIYCNHPKAPKSKSYRKKIKNFLEYKDHNQKPFYTFNQIEVDKFIEMLIDAGYGGGGIDPFISAISRCAQILRDEYPDTFPSTFLISISKSRINEVSKSYGGVLTLLQLSLIKKFTIEQGDSFEKFVFEELFQKGVQLEELQSNGRSNFDSSVDYIYKANQYFRKLTQYLREKGEYANTKNINSEHFKQSHQAYFFTCPICQEKFENLEENWVLVRTEFDSQYRLVHAACKDRLM